MDNIEANQHSPIGSVQYICYISLFKLKFSGDTVVQLMFC